MGELFGKTQWSKELEGFKRLRAIINVLTRTRFLTANGEMDYDAKLFSGRNVIGTDSLVQVSR